jgi:GTP cyclohydrolase I
MEDKSANPQDPQREIVEKLRDVCPTPWLDNGLSDDEKIQMIEQHFKAIMATLGMDLSDDSLCDTPKRLAKMYVKELFSGLNLNSFPKMTCIENKMQCNEMVTVSNIRFISVCEHHFATIDGHATVSYIPKNKIIGLSKINRIVKFFARRPQVQERLTKQIADALEKILGTEDVAVHIKAKHYCVISRGVEDTESETTTTELRGRFKQPEVRAEFLRATGK